VSMSICKGGLFRLLRPGVLEHWCPGCEEIHAIDIHAMSKDGRVTGWNGDLVQPSIGEPLHHDTPAGACDYTLRGGVMYFTSDCWHPLAGQQRHLPEFPR
jgi:hypothetical protein